MKRISIAFFAGILFLTSCGDSGSSTIGDWSKEESAEKTEHNTEGHAAEQHENASEENTTDTTKTSLKAGENGAEAKTGRGSDSTPHSGGAKAE